MAYQFSVHNFKPTLTRKLPMLPRFAFYLDIAGKQFVYKQTPILETLLNLREQGFTVKNLMSVATQQFNEIVFPSGLSLKESAKSSAKKKPSRKRVR